jgi:hydrogenase nickel incorporation protein HypA/HybF
MHEAKIASLILQKAAVQAASYEKILKVQKIELAVGKFRNVDVESLQFAFNALKEEFPLLIDAVLDVHEIEAQALCKENGHNYVVDLQKNFACPICGSGVGSLQSGKELEIRKILLETQECSYA